MRFSITENNSFVTLLAWFLSMLFPHLYSILCVISSLSVSSHSSPSLSEGWGEVLFSHVSTCVTRGLRRWLTTCSFCWRKGAVGSRVKGVLVYSTSPLPTALRNITLHLKMGREKVKLGRGNCHKILNSMHTNISLSPFTQQWSSPNTLFPSSCSYLLIGGACLFGFFFQKSIFNSEITATVCFHHFL